MAQKIVSQSQPLGRALDQPRNISRDKTFSVVNVDDSEHRSESCEMVIRNFRARRAYHGEQRRLADVWHTYKTDVREHFQLERKLKFFAFRAVFGKSRRLARRRCKVFVSPAAASAVREYERLASAHIFYQPPRFRVADDRPVGDGNNKIGGVCAVEFFRAAVAAVLRNEFFARAEIEQGVLALVNYENDVSAVAAVAARRTAVRYVFFAVKRNASIAAVARLNVYFDVIVKICHSYTPILCISFK